MVIAFNAVHNGANHPTGKHTGILIEAKDGDMYRNYRPGKISIGAKILEVLKRYDLDSWEGSVKQKCPIFLHSFDDFTVEEWHSLGTNLPLHQLVEEATLGKNGKPSSLADFAEKAAKYSHGLGVESTLVYDPVAKKPKKDVLDQIKALNMMLHVWTFRDDQLLFGAKDAIVMSMLFSKCTRLARMC